MERGASPQPNLGRRKAPVAIDWTAPTFRFTRRIGHPVLSALRAAKHAYEIGSGSDSAHSREAEAFPKSPFVIITMGNHRSGGGDKRGLVAG